MNTDSKNGFTLIEVLVALAIMGVVTTALFKTLQTQNTHYLAQDEISTIQQSARASIDELTRQVRQTGFGVPSAFPSIYATNTNPDTVTLVYQVKDCKTFLTAAMPSTSSDIVCNGSLACFEDGQDAFIYEADSLKGEFFVISQVNQGSQSLQHSTTPLTRRFGANSVVLSLIATKFYCDNTSDTLHPKLMVKYGSRAAATYADDVSDFQLRYRMKNGLVLDVPTLAADVREVLITITGRSERPDPDKTGPDRYRTRTFSSSASLRNLGI